MFKHLQDSQESYSSHCRWAVSAGFTMIWAGLLSIVHGLIPSLFPFRSAKTVIDLYYKRLHNHNNKSYKDYIEHVSTVESSKQSAS
jgi:hypothetical protein